MSVGQSEKSLFEKGFDDDLSIEQMEEMLSVFPSVTNVANLLFRLREQNSFTDMKRGDLYPEVIGGTARLRRTIAKVYGVDIVQAQPNFSCNGCIDTFFSYIQRLELLHSNRKGLLVATPTYFRYYHKAEALRTKLLGIPMETDYAYPLDKIITALKSEAPSCLLLVTPNNPTGIPISDDQLLEILDNVPDDLDVAIDRTCANIAPEISTKTLLQRYSHKRVAIFHSFSKYYNMSHLRIGFTVFSNKEMAAEVDRYLPFGLNLEAVLRATYILTARGEVAPHEQVLNFIAENRVIMREFLSRRDDYACSDFKSNYAIITLPKSISSREFQLRLLDKGISIMSGHELPAPDERIARIHTGGRPLHLRRMFEVIEGWA